MKKLSLTEATCKALEGKLNTVCNKKVEARDYSKEELELINTWMKEHNGMSIEELQNELNNKAGNETKASDNSRLARLKQKSTDSKANIENNYKRIFSDYEKTLYENTNGLSDQEIVDIILDRCEESSDKGNNVLYLTYTYGYIDEYGYLETDEDIHHILKTRYPNSFGKIIFKENIAPCYDNDYRKLVAYEKYNNQIKESFEKRLNKLITMLKNEGLDCELDKDESEYYFSENRDNKGFFYLKLEYNIKW